MATPQHVLDHVRSALGGGEQVRAVESAVLKVSGNGKRVAKDAAVSTAASVALGALTGFGVMRVSTPPTVYVAVTDARLLLFATEQPTGVGRRRATDLIFAAPLDAVAVEERNGLYKRLAVADRATGTELAVLNFSQRTGARTAVARAAGG